MAGRKPKTWLELAVTNAGFRQGIRAMTFVHLWGVAREALGHEPSAEELANWWNSPERTIYREQAAFRQAFPTLETPAPIADNPENRRRFKELAKRSAELDDAIHARRDAKRSRLSDSAILRIGLAGGPE